MIQKRWKGNKYTSIYTIQSRAINLTVILATLSHRSIPVNVVLLRYNGITPRVYRSSTRNPQYLVASKLASPYSVHTAGQYYYKTSNPATKSRLCYIRSIPFRFSVCNLTRAISMQRACRHKATKYRRDQPYNGLLGCNLQSCNVCSNFLHPPVQIPSMQLL